MKAVALAAAFLIKNKIGEKMEREKLKSKNSDDGSITTVYEVRKFTIELEQDPYTVENAENEFSKLDNQDSEVLSKFTTLQEAEHYLDKCKSTIRFTEGYVHSYYICDVTFIEENKYDQDGDWLSGGDRCKILPFNRYFIVEKADRENYSPNEVNYEYATDNYDFAEIKIEEINKEEIELGEKPTNYIIVDEYGKPVESPHLNEIKDKKIIS